MGQNDSLVIHLTLIPFLAAAGELKTKPTQHSVKMLLEYGIQPDILVCRTEHHINMDIRKKIALFCNVNVNAVIESIDASTIYDVPLLMLKEQLDKTVMSKLKLSSKQEPNLERWKDFLGRLKNPTAEIRIGLLVNTLNCLTLTNPSPNRSSTQVLKTSVRCVWNPSAPNN